MAPLAVLAALLAVTIGPAPTFAAPGPATVAAKKAKTAKVTITKVSAKGAKVTVAGRVTLPSSVKNTAKNRKKAQVSLTLASSGGNSETFTATVTSKLTFAATKTTRLTGPLSLDAQVKISGKKSGKAASKQVTVTVKTTVAGSTPGTSTPGTTTPGTPTPASGSADPQGIPLVGLFRLDAGQQAVSGKLSGTWFRMHDVENGDSTALDKRYTLLRPGTDGGLRTDVYQEPPAPAFDALDPVNNGPDGLPLPTGNAVASRIILPQKFFNVGFSIVTAPVDLQAALPDPLPRIVSTNGALSGQVTAWTAQWNGLSFNQGAPKPDGTIGGGGYNGGTSPLTGTYDAATRRFKLNWTSLIQGGPFSGFIGEWNLEGTFEPAVTR